MVVNHRIVQLGDMGGRCRLYVYRIKAHNRETGAEGYDNRLVPRLAGLGKGLGPAQNAGLQKRFSQRIRSPHKDNVVPKGRPVLITAEIAEHAEKSNFLLNTY